VTAGSCPPGQQASQGKTTGCTTDELAKHEAPPASAHKVRAGPQKRNALEALNPIRLQIKEQRPTLPFSYVPHCRQDSVDDNNHITRRNVCFTVYLGSEFLTAGSIESKKPGVTNFF
jgi:hypothetical protein